MAAPALYPRLVESAVSEALDDTPVVLLHGPRQCGKTTLARVIGEGAGFGYYTFDDAGTSAAATADPVGFVDDLPRRAILDEVQRVPRLFQTLKVAIDRDRAPGRFLLTGSANVLLVPHLSDSLAGRMEIVRLHPLTQAELAGRAPSLVSALFEGGGLTTTKRPRLGRDLAARVASGGFPAALARPTGRRRAAWYRDYVEAIVQRDVRELARIAALDALPRLLSLAAGQTSRLLNISDLAAPFHVSRPTIRDYVTLLERVFLIDLLPPWHSNRLSRLVKTPKLHVDDTGLACALLGLDADGLWKDRAAFGQLIETFVYQELRRQADALVPGVRFFHFRDRDGVEVDLVLERGARDVVGVEVKAGATVTAADFRGLHKLREACGARFKAGVVLYDGEDSLPFGEGMRALPLSQLWER
jgi:predicted AAA+ superfamily ATPase